MQSIQALRERRTALATNLHTLLDKNPGDKWNAELQTQYDQAMAEIENIDAEAKRIQNVLDAIAEGTQTDAIRTIAERKAHDNKQPAHLVLFNKLMREGERAMSSDDWATLRNTMSVGTDRKSTRLNSSHLKLSRMPSSA